MEEVAAHVPQVAVIQQRCWVVREAERAGQDCDFCLLDCGSGGRVDTWSARVSMRGGDAEQALGDLSCAAPEQFHRGACRRLQPWPWNTPMHDARQHARAAALVESVDAVAADMTAQAGEVALETFRDDLLTRGPD